MKPFLSHFKLAKEYQEYIRKVFMPQYGNEATFSTFFTSQTLKCLISQNTEAKPCGFIRGIHVLPLNSKVSLA